MTDEERDIIARFIARVGGAGSSFGGAQGSVPGVAPGPAPSLPPIDPQADAYIRDQFASHPEAPYRITQMAFVQEAALTEAQSRIQRLQWELNQARQQAQSAQPQSRGFLGGLFGGGSAPQSPPSQQYQPPPPPPQYAPGMAQPGMFQRSDSGFLGSALTTAAGVAGGMVVGNALMDMFSPHNAGFGGGGFGAGGFGGLGAAPGETVVNNYYNNDAPSAAPDPWGGAGVTAPDQSNGYWSKDDVYGSAGTAEPPPADQGGNDPGWGGTSGTSGTSGAGGDDGWT